jgi:hypothetical protein
MAELFHRKVPSSLCEERQKSLIAYAAMQNI